MRACASLACLLAALAAATPVRAEPAATRARMALVDLPREDSGTPGWLAPRSRCADLAETRQEREARRPDARPRPRGEDGCGLPRAHKGTGWLYGLVGALGAGGIAAALGGGSHDEDGG